MASLFGEVATEFGGTVKDLATQKREERLLDEEQQRELQLAKQRMTHESGLLDRRIGADDLRETRRQEYETTMYDMETKARQTESEADRTASYDEALLGSQTDIIQSLIRANATRSASGAGSMSGGGWKVNMQPDTTVMDPETGQMVVRPGSRTAMSETHGAYELRGDYAFPAGDPNPQVYPFASKDEQRNAESLLFNGTKSEQEFKDQFGYVPTTWIYGKVTNDKPDIRGQLDSYGIELPWAKKAGKGERRGGTESEQIEKRRYGGPEVAGPQATAPMKPSLEEVSAGPQRDANIAAKGGLNETLEAAYRASGAPEGTFARNAGQPAVADRIGDIPTQADAGLLTQGQASEEAPVEQGGQLGPTRAAAEALPAPDLSDADAVEIAEAVSKMSTKQLQSSGQLSDEITDPLGAFKEMGGILAVPFQKPATPRHPRSE